MGKMRERGEYKKGGGERGKEREKRREEDKRKC